MRIERITYGRKFNLGDYETEYIELSAELEQGDIRKACLDNLRREVHELRGKARIDPDLTIERVEKSLGDLAREFTFQQTRDSILVKPKQFLGSETFGKAASIIRELNGQYISAGRDSHFKLGVKA